MSPVYDFLETNIPHTLMNYSDKAFPETSSLFPRHEVVREYLESYAKELEPMLSLGTQVLSIKKTQNTSRARWEVEVLDLKTDKRRIEEFDAVMIASGHYNDPFIPEIKGLAEFNRIHPGCISHSKFYRRPDQYADKVSSGHSKYTFCTVQLAETRLTIYLRKWSLWETRHREST